MRFYFNSSDEEFKFELIEKTYQNQKTYTLINDDGSEVSAQVKRIGQKYFYTTDGVKWNRLRTMASQGKMVFSNQIYTKYKGFKPSSLFDEAGGGLVTQIPGKVIEINCKVGDSVKQGQTLMILEAMKMENEIKSNQDGIVSAIYIKEAQSLEAGTLMIEVVDSL